MPEPREARSLIDEAEKAAAAGDYASAEQLLRQAALLQEADLGPLHPHLARTLNNLGVVCEITNKPDDAEQFYRGAYEIAAAVLAADHPFVATSRQNLNDFCRTRGRTVESPLPSPAEPAKREAPAERSAPLPEAERSVPVPPPGPSAAVPRAQTSATESRRLPAERVSHRLAIAVLCVCGLVIVAFMAMRPWFRSSEPGQAQVVAATQSPPEAPAPPREPVEPIAAPKEVTSSPRRAAVEGSRGSSASVPAPPMLASAQLCRALSVGGSADGWQCTPPRRPVDAGLLFFYTRVKSAIDTTVEHRWYRDDRLYNSVNLRVRANQTDGYRTNSRFTIPTRSSGNWKVELRTRDGILLHEERFVVR